MKVEGQNLAWGVEHLLWRLKLLENARKEGGDHRSLDYAEKDSNLANDDDPEQSLLNDNRNNEELEVKEEQRNEQVALGVGQEPSRHNLL